MSVRREIYISSGRKNGFYTLRSNTTGKVGDSVVSTDMYLRTLSTDADKAEAKAREYFDRVYGDRCLDVVFMGFADFDLTPWGQCLEPWKLKQLASIESDVWPFGKHQGTRISESPDGYIMFWAQKPSGDDVVLAAIVELCRSVADERGLDVKFEERRRAIQEERARDAEVSRHVGEVGKRMDLDVTVTFRTQYDGMYGTTYVYVCKDTAGNVVVGKFSKPLGMDVDSRTFRAADRGSRVVMVASVKAHGEREGVKQTIVQRPKVKTVEHAA